MNPESHFNSFVFKHLKKDIINLLKEIAERKKSFKNKGRITKSELLDIKIDINLFK